MASVSSPLLWVLLLSLVNCAFGQYLTEIYTNAVVSTGSEIFGGSSTEDVVGNVYQVFMFPGGSSLTIGEISLSNQGGFDTALVKFDSIGNVDWVRALQSPGNEEFFQVATDTAGNVYVAGFTDTSQLGMTLDGSWDGILLKYDTNGNLMWITNQYSGLYTHGNQDVLSAIAYSNNFLYIIQQTVYGTAQIIQTDLNGAPQWHYGIPLVNVQQYNFNQLVVDPLRNQIYIVGQMLGNQWNGAYYYGEWSSQVQNGKTVTGFTMQNWDGFLFALGTNGFSNWVVPQQTSNNDGTYALALDAAGYIYVDGCSGGSMFGQPYAGGGGCNPFVAKYDSLGNRLWTRDYNQYQNWAAHSIVLDNFGALYVRVTDGYNQQIIKSDTNGNIIWTYPMPGTVGLSREGNWNLPFGFDRGANNAFLDSTGSLVLSGLYQNQFFGWASNPFVPYISKWQLNLTCANCQQFDALLAELQTLLNIVAA